MDWDKGITKEDFQKMFGGIWGGFLDFYKYYKAAFWIIISSIVFLSGVTFLIVRFFEPPLKEGKIVELFHDDEHVAYLLGRKSVNRSESYTTIVDGKTVIRTRSVFDHYEYCVEKHFDGEDWFVQIQQKSEKREGKIRQRYIFVQQDRFKMLDKGDWFVAKLRKEGTDTIREKNNRVERMTRWTRSRIKAVARLATYKTQEY